jgi:hypothetical protein
LELFETGASDQNSSMTANQKINWELYEMKIEEIDSYLLLQDVLQKRVNVVLSEIHKISKDTDQNYYLDITSGDVIYIEAGMVYTEETISSRCSCCSDETDRNSFPISYLSSDDWKEELIEKIAKKKEEATIQEENKKQKLNDQAKENELALLAKLKEKYPESNSN